MRWARCTTSCMPRSSSPTTTCTPAASTSRTAVSRMPRTWSRSKATRWPSSAPHMWIGSRRSTAAGLSQRVRQLPNLRVLWAGSALAVLLIVGLLIALPRLQPATGTLLVLAAARSPDALAPTNVSLHGSAGWTAIGSVSGSVPAAPEQRELLALPVAVGAYDGVRLGAEEQSVAISLVAGQVEPLLLGIESGHLIIGAAYAGNDQVNLGLGELSGRFWPMPAFALADQAGRPFNNSAIAGNDVVIAAFHTTCHQTCPLYTALFEQLEKQKLPSNVVLAEVTTDPATDVPSVLASYAKSINASWTFATGTPDQLTEFWKPFGVALATGDSHVSTLALLDRHGYIRLVYRGVPAVGHDIAPALVTSLGAEGLRELASGAAGCGWWRRAELFAPGHRGAARESWGTAWQAAGHQLLGHVLPAVPCGDAVAGEPRGCASVGAARPNR